MKNDLKGLENTVWGIDIEIAGIYIWKKYKIEKIIVVNNQLRPRSCIVIDGKILENGRCCNINNIIENEIEDAIKMIADIFQDSEILLFECINQDILKEKLIKKGLRVLNLEIDSEALVNQLRELL